MATVSMISKDSLVDEMTEMHERIARRAYQLFCDRDPLWGDPFADWLMAEQELVWKPPVELREQNGTFTVSAALPGIPAKDIEVDITPQDVVIKAATEHTHKEEQGRIYQCEFTTAQVFRSIPFPKPIDVTKARADYQNGVLNITVPVAPDGGTTRVPVGVS